MKNSERFKDLRFPPPNWAVGISRDSALFFNRKMCEATEQYDLGNYRASDRARQMAYDHVSIKMRKKRNGRSN